MTHLLRSVRRRGTEETEDEAANPAAARVRGLNARTALLAVAALAVGFAIGRRLRRRGPSADELRERAGEAMPADGVEVPIGGSETEETDEAEGTEEAEESAPADPTLEEVDERTESDVEEEPAEPGEMYVDEELDEGEDDEGEMAPDEAADVDEREDEDDETEE